jgi:hypothetical protein
MHWYFHNAYAYSVAIYYHPWYENLDYEDGAHAERHKQSTTWKFMCLPSQDHIYHQCNINVVCVINFEVIKFLWTFVKLHLVVFKHV